MVYLWQCAKRDHRASNVRKNGGRVMSHSMPESAKALWRIVSFTAANTRRMFEVSVACVRLRRTSVSRPEQYLGFHSLRVKVEMRSIHLVESP